MSRGPRSDRAIAAAEPIARMRGEVMFLEQRPGACFDLLTSGPAGTSAVRAERSLRIHGTLAGIAADHAGTIARINAAALAPGISRELWLWSPWGTMRYFRIESESITELDRLGAVRAPLVKGALAGAMRPRWRTSRKKSGGGALPTGPGPGQSPAAGDPLPAVPGPEKLPGTGSGPQPPGIPGPAPPAGTGEHESAPVRYLRRRAAEMKRQKEEGAGGERSPGGLPEIV